MDTIIFTEEQPVVYVRLNSLTVVLYIYTQILVPAFRPKGAHQQRPNTTQWHRDRLHICACYNFEIEILADTELFGFRAGPQVILLHYGRGVYVILTCRLIAAPWLYLQFWFAMCTINASL